MSVLVAYGVVFVLVVLTGFRRPSDRALALFSDVYAVPITSVNRRVVEHFVRWSRSGRMAGLVAGFALMFVMPEETRLLWPVVGYGLGAVLAELLRPGVPGSAAALRRRRLADYVGRELVFVLAINSTLVIGCLVVGVLAGWTASVADGTRSLAAASAGYLILAVIASRRIIGAPQPVENRDLDAAEHAVRSSALVALVGLAYVALGQLSLMVWQLTMDGSLRWVGLLAAWTAGLSGMGGMIITFRSLPRFAPFWRSLPSIAPSGVDL
jgi:hypothetical protein